MVIAAAIPLADGFGMHGDGDVGVGWIILMGMMMVLFMGGMMWMMMRGMGGDSGRVPSGPWQRSTTRETAMETLDRRFAAGEISIEEYQTRRAALADGNAEPSADAEEAQPTAPPTGEGSR